MASLSPRLSLAESYAKEGLVTMDVGADHGYLSLALAKKGYKVYAGENKKGPYETLTRSIRGSDVIPLFSDGLEKMPSDVKQVYILGMGGDTILRILENSPKKTAQVLRYILSPQSSFSLPIGYLLSQGYINIDGTYVFEKRYYPLLVFEKAEGKKDYTSAEKEYGPYPVRKHDALLLSYLEEEIAEKKRHLPFQEEALEKLLKDRKEIKPSDE